MARLFVWLVLAAACTCYALEEAAAPAAAENASAAEAGAKEETKSFEPIILLGGIGFIFSMYYMVNSHLPGVSAQTWSMISTSVSIFAAVMTYNCVKTLSLMVFSLKEAAGEESDAAYHAVTGQHVLVSTFGLVMWWLVVLTMLFVQRMSKLRLVAWGTIGGHILGFAAIDLYGGTIAMLPMFHDSPSKHLLVLLIYVATVPLFVAPLRFLIVLILKVVHVPEKAVDRFHDQCKDTAIDFFCMGASFVICLTCRGYIQYSRTGKAADAHAVSVKHAPHETGILILCGLVFLALGGSCRAVHAKMSEGALGSLTDVLATTLSLSSAWCLLDAANWFFLHRFEKAIMAKLCVAMTFSAVFVIATVGLSRLLNTLHGSMKQVLRGEFLAISLAVGLGWEHLFDTALEDAGEFVEDPTRKKLFVSLITLALVAVVFPAWTVYMLPKHDPELLEEYAGVTLRPFQAFSDCDGGDEEELELEEDEELMSGEE